MGDLNGDVMAISTFGEFVFAGGDFTTASGAPASHLARYYAGYWRQVHSGVDGTVFALTRKFVCMCGTRVCVFLFFCLCVCGIYAGLAFVCICVCVCVVYMWDLRVCVCVCVVYMWDLRVCVCVCVWYICRTSVCV